jgi:hypothetical protein
MTLRSVAYLAYALFCEQRARAESDPIAKREWEQTAIDWHRMTRKVAETDDRGDKELDLGR